MCHLLRSFIVKENSEIANQYLEAKMELKKLVSPKDYVYFNFQIWQEGFPRFLEVDLLDLKQKIKPQEEDEQLKSKYLTEIKQALENPDFSNRKRILFYSLGAAEWMLIKQVNPKWKETYMGQMFETDYLLRP